MSDQLYVTDHFKWIKLRNRRPGSAAAAKAARLPSELTVFQGDAVQVLSIAFRGAHNVPFQWENVDWKYGGGISFCLRSHTLSTFDCNTLTLLVLLCHEHRIRLEISAVSFRMLRLTMHPRKAEGSMSERHPNIDEAVSDFRRRYKWAIP